MQAIEWLGNSVRFIDQTKLPFHEEYITTESYFTLIEAIRSLRIRGAPLIGIAAAYGVVLAAVHYSPSDIQAFRAHLMKVSHELSLSRPTAINLFWALGRMEKVIQRSMNIHETTENLVQEALLIHDEDRTMCRSIGDNGAELIPENAIIITICNTGILATGGEGTAQSVITSAHRQDKHIKVFACETRPALQGARLTTWELLKHGVDVTLISDNMAAALMRRKHVDCVITGADRIAANGDTANKIGTYNLAVLAHHHGIPFYIAAPTSTIDLSIHDGSQIPIEERNPAEVRELLGKPIAPPNVQVWNPAFDVTPSELISAIITQRGVRYPPFHFDDKLNG